MTDKLQEYAKQLDHDHNCDSLFCFCGLQAYLDTIHDAAQLDDINVVDIENGREDD